MANVIGTMANVSSCPPREIYLIEGERGILPADHHHVTPTPVPMKTGHPLQQEEYGRRRSGQLPAGRAGLKEDPVSQMR